MLRLHHSLSLSCQISGSLSALLYSNTVAGEQKGVGSPCTRIRLFNFQMVDLSRGSFGVRSSHRSLSLVPRSHNSSFRSHRPQLRRPTLTFTRNLSSHGAQGRTLDTIRKAQVCPVDLTRILSKWRMNQPDSTCWLCSVAPVDFRAFPSATTEVLGQDEEEQQPASDLVEASRKMVGDHAHVIT